MAWLAQFLLTITTLSTVLPIQGLFLKLHLPQHPVSVLDFKCPKDDNCTITGCLYQNDDDCTKFFQCDLKGNVFKRECPHGLEFNENVRVCDWPPSPTCPRSEPEPEPEPEPFKCPEDDDCTITGCLYQDDNDCTKFFQCDLHGNLFKRECPHGLEFNEKIRVCDWPPSPTCPRKSGTEPKPGPEPVPVPVPETAFKCPEGDNCTITGCLYQNNENCTEFYQCDLSGRAFKRQCPHGLEFNENVRVCDWPPSPTCPKDEESEL